jgi:chromosome partitioning protein
VTDTRPAAGERHVFATNKGGVGKTLWVLELAAALARRGRNVLVVDVDPQANLTRRMRVALDEETPTLTTVLQLGKPATVAIQPCGWDAPEAETIDVLPSDIDLELRSLEAGAPGAVLRLRKALESIGDAYQHVLFDCPPSLGHLTQMAVAAAGKRGRVYLPLEPERDAIRGAARTRAFVEEYAEDLHSEGIRVEAVLVNGVEAGTVLHRQRISELPGVFGKSDTTGRAVPIWEPYVPNKIRIAEIHDAGRPTSTDSDMVKVGVVAAFDAIADRMES